MALVLLLAGCAAAPAPPARAQDPGLLRDAGQHVVVVVEERSSTSGTLFRFQREGETWRRAGDPVPVVVGSAGVAKEREGDGRAPQGVFSLGRAFGYAPAPPPGTRLPYEAMRSATVCVDDPRSRHYNRIVHRDEADADWNSAEAMRRDLAHGDHLYELGITVGYNPDNAPGAGSCIFLHVWRDAGSPTAGCTAMPEHGLRALLGWLRPEARPVLVQGTRAHFESLHTQGLLPYPVPEGP